MVPEHYNFGGGSPTTILHPIILVAMIVLTLAILLLPRKYTIAAFLIGALLIPTGQQIVVSSFHLYVSRIIVLAGLFRMLGSTITTGKLRIAGGWNIIDTAFAFFVTCHALAFSLQYMDATAVANQIGFMWDYLGAYLVLRYAIQDKEDLRRTLKCFVLITVIVAVSMIREQFTGHNIFGLLGGVRLMSEVRDGHIRSQGVFQHAILAGTFGAVMLPLFVALWKSERSRLLAVVGIVSCTVMTLTTLSSTPVLTYLAAIIAISLWPLRNWMREIRWGIVLGLVVLNAVMKAPVWYLIAHVGIVAGSSAYHRADLVNTFIQHFKDWWLLGTQSNYNWGYEMFDTANEYVHMGVTGGLFALTFLIFTLSRAFGRIGTFRKTVQGTDRRVEWLSWLLGCSLLAHTVAFFGIHYFDQTKISLFALLAMVSAVSSPLAAAAHPRRSATIAAPVFPSNSYTPAHITELHTRSRL